MRAEEMELRDLVADDLFPMVALLSKIGMSELMERIGPDLIEAAKFSQPVKIGKGGKTTPIPRSEWTEGQLRAAAKADAAQSRMIAIGVETVLANFGICKNEIYTLLASGFCVSTDDVASLTLAELLGLLDRYINREAFADFFMQAFKLVSHTGTFISRINFTGVTDQA